LHGLIKNLGCEDTKKSGPADNDARRIVLVLSKNDKYYLFFINKLYLCPCSKTNCDAAKDRQPTGKSALRRPHGYRNDRQKMQNKKPLLRRLLAIYVAFFIVILADMTLEAGPGFSQGWNEGNEMGMDITRRWALGTPHKIYMLENIRISDGPEETLPIAATAPDATVRTRIRKIGLTVDEEAPGTTISSLAFSSIGGNGWLYLAVMLCCVAFLAIIVLMFLIVHSVRRSIREERALERRNVWRLRAIGLLAIAAELLDDLVGWAMNSRAAELLNGSGYVVDTAFHVSYSRILMAILILFAAEVFAVGQNLSEEQKLTI